MKDGVTEFNETITEAIGYATNLLVAALSGSSGPWSTHLDFDTWWEPDSLILDPGGPWWSGPLNEFKNLSSTDQNWVLGQIVVAVPPIADWMERMAKRQHWSWIWSEVPLAAWGSARPSIARPDLLIRRDWKDSKGLALDLKVRTGRAVKQEDEDEINSWLPGLKAIGFPTGGVLALLIADPYGADKPLPLSVGKFEPGPAIFI